MRRHVLAAGAAVVAFAALAAAFHALQVRRLASAQLDLQEAQLRLGQARREAVAPAPSVPALAAPGTIDAVTHDLGRLATDKAVRVHAIRIDGDTARAPAIGEVRIDARASGDYAAVKAWVGELLARHRPLSIASLSLRRPAPDQPLVEAQLTLSLFVRGTP